MSPTSYLAALPRDDSGTRDIVWAETENVKLNKAQLGALLPLTDD